MPIGRAFGVPEALLPKDLDAFEAYVAGMLAPDGPVKPGPLARDLAGVILHPPLAPLLPAAAPLLGADPARRLRLDAVAIDRAVAADRPRGLRAPVGRSRTGWSRPGSSPAGVPGDRSSRERGARCRRRSPRIARVATAAAGEATYEASVGNRNRNIVDHRSSGVAASSVSSSERVPAIS